MRSPTKILLCAAIVCVSLAVGLALLPQPAPRLNRGDISVRTSPRGYLTLLNLTSNTIMARVTTFDAAKPNRPLFDGTAVLLSPDHAVAVSLGSFSDSIGAPYDIHVTASAELRGVEKLLAACRYYLLQLLHKSQRVILSGPGTAISPAYYGRDVLVWKGRVEISNTPAIQVIALP